MRHRWFDHREDAAYLRKSGSRDDFFVGGAGKHRSGQDRGRLGRHFGPKGPGIESEGVDTDDESVELHV